MPPEAIRVVVCERMGWTLDYFDGLDLDDVSGVLAVWDGMQKAGHAPGGRGGAGMSDG